MVEPADRPLARKLLAAVGVKGTAYPRYGTQQWLVTVRAADSDIPPAGERDEWLARLADHLEEAAGVRPLVRVEE
jgi:hypothetical protein